jgi:hypothetical protein
MRFRELCDEARSNHLEAAAPRPSGLVLAVIMILFGAGAPAAESARREIAIPSLENRPAELRAGEFFGNELTWWLPNGAESLVLPVAAGLVVETSKADLMRWLRDGSPWNLMELPLVGARYGNTMLGVIVPYPHYAELVFEERVGIRFSFPKDRRNAAPANLIAVRCGREPLELARVFREWRQSVEKTGSVPRRKILKQKAAENPRVAWLFGAPHFYLWGSALFSRHDVERQKWVPLARWLRGVETGTLGEKVMKRFNESQRQALEQLAGAEQPGDFLTSEVAAGMERALADPTLLGGGESTAEKSDKPLLELLRVNREAVGAAFRQFCSRAGKLGRWRFDADARIAARRSNRTGVAVAFGFVRRFSASRGGGSGDGAWLLVWAIRFVPFGSFAGCRGGSHVGNGAVRRSGI